VNRCRLELTRVATKHQMLLFKLQRLIVYFNDLRDLWAGQRGAFTEEEKVAKEHDVRILDLSLQSGIGPSQVEQLLADFEATARPAASAIEMSNGRDFEHFVRKIVDDCVLEHLGYCELRHLRKITAGEEEQQKEKILHRCRLAVVALRGDGGLLQEEPPTMPALLATRLGDNFAAVPAGGTVGQILALCTEGRSWVAGLLRRACQALIDDHLFLRHGDESLWSHQRSNSLPNLFGKALCSQTLPLLLASTSLQFATYQSVAAAITCSAVLLSFMAFPHAPPLFWKTVQRYNFLVITLKMIYQLPIFCSDGSLSFRGCSVPASASASLDGRGVPCWAVLGLLKIQPPVDTVIARDGAVHDRGLTFSSVADAFWADLLVCALLFLHWDMLCRGGQLGDLNRIYRPLQEQYRTRSTLSMDGEILQSSLAGSDELPASQCEPPCADDKNKRGPWFQHAAAVVSDYLVGSVQICKPAMDLYVLRFMVAMLCFSIVLLFWRSLTGTGWSFAASLTTNVFSGRQVIAAILFLVLIVVDRMLYISYVQDHSLTEKNLAVSAACTAVAECSPTFGVMRSNQLLASRGGTAGSPEASPGPGLASPGAAARLAATGSSRVLDQPDGVTTHGGSVSGGERSTVLGGGGDFMSGSTSRRLMATIVQRTLVVVQLIALHSVCIAQWSAGGNATNAQVSMTSNPTLFIFYMLYILYLALTAAQQRYDVSIVHGGLGLTQRTDIVSWLIFKAYIAVPFLGELRVLADWTATRTALNYVMWMKLEDAHQNLYNTRCDMEARRMLPPAAPRPFWEKVLQGGLLMGALFALIVGPVMFFSTLNISIVPSLVYSGKLDVSLEARADSVGVRTATLYEAGHTHIRALSRDKIAGFIEQQPPVESSADVSWQEVLFPISSSAFWLMLPSLRRDMATILSKPGMTATLVFSLTLRRNGSTTSLWGYGHQSVPLSRFQAADFARVLNDTTLAGQASFAIPAALVPLFHFGSSTQMSPRGAAKPVTLSLHSEEVGSADLPFWALNQKAGECPPLVPAVDSDRRRLGFLQRRRQPSSPPVPGRLLSPEAGRQLLVGGASTRSCGLSFQVSSEMDRGSTVANDHSGSWTIIGIYLGVVYTIGRFLRMVFQDASKRMIYEELPDTELLEDLCNGIYISRIHGLLETEYGLYYELVRIYRSPMLLLSVSQPQGGAVCDSVALPAGGTDGFCGGMRRLRRSTHGGGQQGLKIPIPRRGRKASHHSALSGSSSSHGRGAAHEFAMTRAASSRCTL